MLEIWREKQQQGTNSLSMCLLQIWKEPKTGEPVESCPSLYLHVSIFFLWLRNLFCLWNLLSSFENCTNSIKPQYTFAPSDFRMIAHCPFYQPQGQSFLSETTIIDTKDKKNKHMSKP